MSIRIGAAARGGRPFIFGRLFAQRAACLFDIARFNLRSAATFGICVVAETPKGPNPCYIRCERGTVWEGI
jgi:hypothetical protein